jgi:hypothetical protein
VSGIGKQFDVLQATYPPYAQATARLKHLLAEYGLGWSDDLEHLPEDVRVAVDDARFDCLAMECNAEILLADGLVN